MCCPNAQRKVEPWRLSGFAVFGVRKALGVAGMLFKEQNWVVGNARPWLRPSVNCLTPPWHQYMCPGDEPEQGTDPGELLAALKSQADQFNGTSCSARSAFWACEACTQLAVPSPFPGCLKRVLLGLGAELLEIPIESNICRA